MRKFVPLLAKAARSGSLFECVFPQRWMRRAFIGSGFVMICAADSIWGRRSDRCVIAGDA